MTDHTYQKKFSQLQPGDLYNSSMREQKAKKMLSVLNEYYSDNLKSLSLLNIGCSTGITTGFLAKQFATVVGIDIDEEAVKFAQENYATDNLEFKVEDAMSLTFSDNHFDVIICSHVYEHVPDYNRLMSEVYRVLKPGGVCFFAAPNQITFIEPHYKLPLLSLIPRRLAHLYLRLLKRGDFYYEKSLTLWQLRKLVRKFEIIDYTEEVIKDPVRYCLTEMIKPGSLKQRLAIFVLKLAYWLCPVYIWLLRKKDGKNNT